ncbi:hypothetical protein JCM10908_006999 [Rhodotorula pacifica]|uniref:uncharacterized protein n=1 Tax=Rhodotorula pacifica TaxID=1495444 RepID=UPI003181F1FE
MKTPAPFEDAPRPPRDRYRLPLLALALTAVLFLTTGPRVPFTAYAPRVGLAQRYCRLDELSKGWWESSPVDSQTWPRLKDSRGYRFGLEGNRTATTCYSRDPATLDALAAANSWRWKPKVCALRPFDPARLVRRLGERAQRRGNGAGILFVGDESARTQSISLESLLGRHIARGYLADGVPFSSVQLEGPAGGLAFSKRDYLVSSRDWQLMLPEDADGGQSVANETEDIWTRRTNGKDIIVVNTGGRWGSITPARLARYIDMAKQVIEYVDQLQTSTLIVRSLVPPLSNCSTFGVTRVGNTTSGDEASEVARDFEAMNNVWKDLLHDHPRHQFLEMPSTWPVAHLSAKVCEAMQRCLPGPVDTWNALLAHAIMGLS